METSPVFIHTHKLPLKVDIGEVLRYMSCGAEVSKEVYALAKRATELLGDALSCKACYTFVSADVLPEDWVDFGFFRIRSKALAKQLKDCKTVCIFAATIGIEADRLRLRAEIEEPSLALALQAAGAAAIESYCDYLCANVFCTQEPALGLRAGMRFSPGYADLDLSHQKNILSVLDSARKIGLTMTDGCMMLPTKSVTAFVGMQEKCLSEMHKCKNCLKTDCSFRRKWGYK